MRGSSVSRGATAVGVSLFSSWYGKSNHRVGEREVIDAIEQPFQTCHRFCTDRQGTYGGWWSSCAWALQGSISSTEVGQYLESSAVREVAPKAELVTDAGAVPVGGSIRTGSRSSGFTRARVLRRAGVCRNFQTPAQARTSGASPKTHSRNRGSRTRTHSSSNSEHPAS